MQNPVTGSGGMLVGVGRRGRRRTSPLGVAVGDRVATLVSLTLTPLQINDELAGWDGRSEQVPCDGHAILFGRSIVAKLPDDLPSARAGRDGRLWRARADRSGGERVRRPRPFPDGPLAREDILENLERQVAATVAEGAELKTGGTRLDQPGYFFPPTVLGGVKPGMTAFVEETFGPVVAITPFTTEDEAVELANDTRYGLGATVWTQDSERGEAVARRIESGLVSVNALVASDPRLPFGGIKRSGYGRELASVGMHEFTNIRTYEGHRVGTPGMSRVFVITGASSGIGAATARHAVEAGYRVVLAARSKDKLDALVEELGGAEHALAVETDVTEWEDNEALIRRRPTLRPGRRRLRQRRLRRRARLAEESPEHWRAWS